MTWLRKISSYAIALFELGQLPFISWNHLAMAGVAFAVAAHSNFQEMPTNPLDPVRLNQAASANDPWLEKEDRVPEPDYALELASLRYRR